VYEQQYKHDGEDAAEQFEPAAHDGALGLMLFSIFVWAHDDCNDKREKDEGEDAKESVPHDSEP
jgi:hypothetical protein